VTWKSKVVAGVKSARQERWDSSGQYAISAGFSFYLRRLGRQAFDIENYLKPTIDALAAGLFCDDDQDTTAIARYNYDDSNFARLYAERLQDAAVATDEGALISVSLR
jgi:Holliday junction resolvase RusA-like endonuclease